MIAPPSGVRVWLACGHTDMRKGMDGLAMLAQQALEQDPFGGALFAFRGKRGGLVKLLWFNGQGMCLFKTTLGNLMPSDRASRAVDDEATGMTGVVDEGGSGCSS